MAAMYTAIAHATGDGRNGHVHSEDDVLDLDIRVPEEMGGPGGATNPEQLFAAGFAACFHNALRVAARRDKLDVEGSEVSASVGIDRGEGGRFALSVALDVHLPGVDGPEAERLAEAAHRICPYSNATRGNVPVTLRVV